MPFPLAHPAAVLPLKHKWPRQLNFAALVIGSICPDAGYLGSRFRLDEYSHSLIGALTFCLPVGLAMTGAFYLTRKFFTGLLPRRQRAPYEALCNQPAGSFWVILFSLILGIATHLVWDSFTHRNGWLRNVIVLHQSLMRIGYHRLTWCQILRYLSSFCGSTWLCYEFERWWHSANPEARVFDRKVAMLSAMSAGFGVILMQLLNDFMGTTLGHLLVLVSIITFVLVVVLRMGLRLRDAGAIPVRRFQETPAAATKV
jgi:hypothetical protein